MKLHQQIQWGGDANNPNETSQVYGVKYTNPRKGYIVGVGADRN